MALSEELYARVEPFIDQIYHDEFIQGIIKGYLPEEAVRRYLRQDSKYLDEFSNLYALLLSKTDDVAGKKLLYEHLDFVLNEKNGAHKVLSRYIGEDYYTVVDTDEWYPTADHYVKHMYYNAYRYSNPIFGLSAMAACPYVYYRLARLINERETIAPDNPFKDWIDFYDTPYTVGDELFNVALDTAGETLSDAEIEIVKKNFLESVEHERDFFNMATGDERWGFERGDY